MLIFNAPKNFKRGKYLFGRYRIIDIICILAVVILSIMSVILFLNIVQSKNIILNFFVVLFMLLPIVIVYLLFLPMPTYFNILDFLLAFGFFHRKQKKWKWEGIHQFEPDEIHGHHVHVEEVLDEE